MNVAVYITTPLSCTGICYQYSVNTVFSNWYRTFVANVFHADDIFWHVIGLIAHVLMRNDSDCLQPRAMKETPKNMMIWNDDAATQVTVTVPDQAALLQELGARFEKGQGFSLATLNLDHVVKLSRDPDFARAYAAHTHITADGNPIVWLSKLAGQQVALIPGSELIDPLTAVAAEKGADIALFGATDDALTAAGDALKKRYPDLNVALTLAPAMGFDPTGQAADNAIAEIKESGAQLVFLALGAPKQEIFAARAHASLSGVGFVSIGAGLDFIAGSQQRAPAWVRAIAAEWIWRMLGSPKRLVGRYAACIAILPKMTWRALRRRSV